MRQFFFLSLSMSYNIYLLPLFSFSLLISSQCYLQSQFLHHYRSNAASLRPVVQHSYFDLYLSWYYYYYYGSWCYYCFYYWSNCRRSIKNCLLLSIHFCCASYRHPASRYSICETVMFGRKKKSIPHSHCS